MAKTVVLLSSGLDSTANLALSLDQGDQVSDALTFSYGQKAAKKEIENAKKISDYYQINHHVVDLPFLGEWSTSSLNQKDRSIPDFLDKNLDDEELTKESAKSVWVPNRNGLMIAVSASFAESIGAEKVLVGFNLEEAKTFPDNSEDYLEVQNQALQFSTKNQVQVNCYTIQDTKKQIVKKIQALKKPFPWHLLWSCYESFEEMCGRCESCQRLIRAKKEIL